MGVYADRTCTGRKPRTHLLVSNSFLGAHADEDYSPYLTLLFEGNTLLPADLTSSAGSGPGEIRYGPGLGTGATLGLRTSSGLRLEGELMYRTTFIRDASVPELGEFDSGGYSSLNLALNALGEFDVFGVEGATTFAGGGPVFVQEIDIDLERNGQSTSFQNRSLGVQALLGGRYALSDTFYLESALRWMVMFDGTLKSGDQRLVAPYSPLSLSVGAGVMF